MTDMFFYGTLRHVPLLQLVLGRPAGALDICDAQLADHAVLQVPDKPFPTITAQSDGRAIGILVRGLSDVDVDRLQFYEGGFDYDARSVTVHPQTGDPVKALVFFPQAAPGPLGALWSFDDWVCKWGALSVLAATEAMGWFGRISASELADRIGPMRIRAAARLAAQARPADPLRDLDNDVSVLAHDRPYLGFFAVEEMDIRFRRHDGTMNRVLNRSALMVGQAAVVLPYDPVRDRVLLIEQFRAPVFMCGDRAPWVWEPVAGLVDPGETPEQAARREAHEEAGLDLLRLEPAGQVYSSTGSSSEFLHLFIGITALTQTDQSGGLEAEGEDIRSQIIGFDDLMAGVDAQVYRDMPLVTTALWLARHRDRLRKTGLTERG